MKTRRCWKECRLESEVFSKVLPKNFGCNNNRYKQLITHTHTHRHTYRNKLLQDFTLTNHGHNLRTLHGLTFVELTLVSRKLHPVGVKSCRVSVCFFKFNWRHNNGTKYVPWSPKNLQWNTPSYLAAKVVHQKTNKFLLIFVTCLIDQCFGTKWT